ncbi:MAG TPA: hypothetical protein VLL25_07960, partial [Acidimicrobiales bacterium]|nr:hypothetical protein [Acidimicrobiales bacterium]
ARCPGITRRSVDDGITAVSIPWRTVPRWKSSELSRLDFESPDRAAFPCLDLAYQAGRAGGTAPACLNGANEVAVAAFLEGRIRWTGINQVIEETLAAQDVTEPDTVDDVLAADADARRKAEAAVDRWVKVA